MELVLESKQMENIDQNSNFYSIYSIESIKWVIYFVSLILFVLIYLN